MGYKGVYIIWICFPGDGIIFTIIFCLKKSELTNSPELLYVAMFCSPHYKLCQSCPWGQKFRKFTVNGCFTTPVLSNDDNADTL